jgi:hypothetical protein
MSKGAEARAFIALVKYRNALARGDNDQTTEASDSFQEIIMDVADEDRQGELYEIFNALVEADAETAFNEFAKVASGFGEVKDAFELGAKMANEGRKSLFFPSTAVELSKVAGAIDGLKKAADQIIEGNGDLEEPFSKKDGEALLKEGQKTRMELDGLIKKLEEITNALPD